MQKLGNWNQDFYGIVFSWDDVPLWVGLNMLLCYNHSNIVTFAGNIAAVFPDVTWIQFRSSSTHRSGLQDMKGRHSDVKTYTLATLRNTEGFM